MRAGMNVPSTLCSLRRFIIDEMGFPPANKKSRLHQNTPGWNRGDTRFMYSARLQKQARGGLRNNDKTARPIPFSDLLGLTKTPVSHKET